MQTVDFFTPVVDDPYLFGQIAAANSLSDVYTVGGRPLTALNILCFPSCKLPLDDMEAILQGGLAKVREAGAEVVGGHSVDDNEPKYGLSVTGLVELQKMVTGSGARPGDCLVLTKPLGTGVIVTSLKGGVLSAKEAAAALEGMARLNAAASRAMLQVGVSACTDVTGFGLLGHLLEMLISSGVGARLHTKEVPFYPGARELAEQGFLPGGAYRNLQFYRKDILLEREDSALEDFLILLADPQTSGGLLISVPPSRLEKLLRELKEQGAEGKAIGTITAAPAAKIVVY